MEVEKAMIRDVILPAALKKAYSGAVEARKHAEREMEIARGEQAVLRKLANLTKMLADNPGLLQLRTLQAFSNSEHVNVTLGDGLFAPVTRDKQSEQ